MGFCGFYERRYRMDIEYIKEFLTLAELLNFSQAASEHYITQPALTRHIQVLEGELGAELFYRSRQSVRLTPVGELFVPEAKKIVDACSDAVRVVRQAANQYTSSLTVSFLDPLIREEMPKWMKVFRERYPAVQVAFVPVNMLSAAEQLQNRTCDIAATLQMPNFTHPDFETFPLYTDTICLYVPEGHRFSGRKEIHLKDLSGEVLLLPSQTLAGEFRQYIEQQLRRAGAKVIFTRYVDSAREAFLLSASGAGVWIAPKHQAIFSSAGILAIPITDPGFYVKVILMWPGKGANPNVYKFIDIVRELQNKKENR